MCEAFVKDAIRVLRLEAFILFVFVSVVIEGYLLVDELLVVLRIQVEELKIEVEGLDLGRLWFVILKVQIF
jgi:hypothetical protein